MEVKYSKRKILSRIVVENSGYYVVASQKIPYRARPIFYFFPSKMDSKRKVKNAVVNQESIKYVNNHSSVGAFLDFLDKDITSRPQILEDISEDLFNRAEKLTEGIEADLDEEFPEDFIFS